MNVLRPSHECAAAISSVPGAGGTKERLTWSTELVGVIWSFFDRWLDVIDVCFAFRNDANQPQVLHTSTGTFTDRKCFIE